MAERQHLILQFYEWWPDPSAALAVRSASPSNPTQKPAHTSALLMCVLKLTVIEPAFALCSESDFCFEKYNMPEGYSLIQMCGAVRAATSNRLPPPATAPPQCAPHATV